MCQQGETREMERRGEETTIEIMIVYEREVGAH
jgi:hypothetical protein